VVARLHSGLSYVYKCKWSTRKCAAPLLEISSASKQWRMVREWSDLLAIQTRPTNAFDTTGVVVVERHPGAVRDALSGQLGRVSVGVNRLSSNSKTGFVAAVVEACRIGEIVPGYRTVVRGRRYQKRNRTAHRLAWLGLGPEPPDWLNSSWTFSSRYVLAFSTRNWLGILFRFSPVPCSTFINMYIRGIPLPLRRSRCCGSST
jgi:hypothetical protein